MPIIDLRDIETNDSESNSTRIEMRKVGDEFTFGKIEVSGLLPIMNLMDDR